MAAPNREFDDFIDNYRGNADRTLSISGDSSEFFAEYKVQKMLEWLPELACGAPRILDYGCGDGVMTDYAKKYLPKAELVGIDPSSESIKEAKENFPGINFDVLEGTRLPYSDNVFDVAFAAGVFHHIDFKDHALYVKELVRVVRPGGQFILFEHNPFNPLTQYIFRTNEVDRDAHMLLPSYSRRLLGGFEGIQIKYYYFFTAFASRLRWLEKRLTWLPLGALYAVIATK
jgi:ubiquinone/menaquinone biosynthesis C-methylase UbiE